MSEKRIKLVSSRLWSVYGSVIAQVCNAFSFDLVDLICAFVYPEPLPFEVLLELKHRTREIDMALAYDHFYLDIHRSSCIRLYLWMGDIGWILDTDRCIASRNRHRYGWAKRDNDARHAFWNMQYKFREKYGDNESFRKDWNRRNDQFYRWRNDESSKEHFRIQDEIKSRGF